MSESERKMVVVDCETIEIAELPENFKAAIDFLLEQYREIDEEHRDNVVQKFDKAWGEFRLSYERPETDQERAARVNQERAALQYQHWQEVGVHAQAIKTMKELMMFYPEQARVIMEQLKETPNAQQ